MLMVPNDFLHDKVQEFFSKIWIKMGINGQRAQTLDLTLLTGWVSSSKAALA